MPRRSPGENAGRHRCEAHLYQRGRTHTADRRAAGEEAQYPVGGDSVERHRRLVNETANGRAKWCRVGGGALQHSARDHQAARRRSRTSHRRQRIRPHLRLNAHRRRSGHRGNAALCGLCAVGSPTAREISSPESEWQHLAVIVDAGPRIITWIVNGVVNDGGAVREYGWGRFSPALRDVNGASKPLWGPARTALLGHAWPCPGCASRGMPLALIQAGHQRRLRRLAPYEWLTCGPGAAAKQVSVLRTVSVYIAGSINEVA